MVGAELDTSAYELLLDCATVIGYRAAMVVSAEIAEVPRGRQGGKEPEPGQLAFAAALSSWSTSDSQEV